MITKENDVALSVKSLTKDFALPVDKKSSLKEHVLHFGRRESIKFNALKGIDLEVKRGEFFGIVGRNGSGKSTLLKLIGGIYQPTKGKIIVNGTLTPFIELGIGFNPELSGRENVFLNGAILGLTRRQINKIYDEIVEFAELEKFMDQKLKNYSSGMQVRLAFSIAIQAHNDILLIDEVLAVGDSAFQRKCFKVFKEIKKSGKTVIFVTHDMGAVQEYCDRAMMIEDSEVILIGKPREVALRYEVANALRAKDEAGKSTRPSNPAIRLDDIKIVNNPTGKGGFSYKDEVEVEVSFTVAEPKAIQFNVFLTKPDGSYLAGKNTSADLKNFTPVKGKGKIRFAIEKGQLVKGQYGICTALYTYCEWPSTEMPDLIDILDPSYGFSAPELVINEQAPNNNGVFNLKGKYTS